MGTEILDTTAMKQFIGTCMLLVMALCTHLAEAQEQPMLSEFQVCEIDVQIVDEEGDPVMGASLVATSGSIGVSADSVGHIACTFEAGHSNRYYVSALGFRSDTFTLAQLTNLDRLVVQAYRYELREAVVAERASTVSGTGRLRNVQGTAIYAGRKSELILPELVQGNLATNSPRELYKSVAGLSIWESDPAGLQLSIGARGLNPNRSANFNTRQNGFDISADALGYPESYYTPPAQALARIELVRGAASLQYGTQFGGLLNFKLKEGESDRRLAVSSEQTLGSYGLFNSFTSLSGTSGKMSYYGFGQYKRGRGWRNNSQFQQGTGYLDVHVQLNQKLRVGLELTRMGYEAQQPGGLLDFEFASTPRLSKRARNWFEVDWSLAALHVDYEWTDRTKLNVRSFVLDAQRNAVGELGPINRPDPMRERDLVKGSYRNFGQEVRLLHRYELANRPATLLLGSRLYSGRTSNRQGLADAGTEASYQFITSDSLLDADFVFPSRNAALFAEQVTYLTSRLSVTPGLRYEYIHTASEGSYRRTVRAGNEVLLDQRQATEARNGRQFVLLGLGTSYRFDKHAAELYANASQNYRSVNFTDLVTLSPNLLIDSTLSDERGYSLEVGFRAEHPSLRWRFDVSLFRLSYANRIGVVGAQIEQEVGGVRDVNLRTNVGAAVTQGVEAYGEFELLAEDYQGPWSLRPFVNLSLTHGRYTSGKSDVVGNSIEYVAPLTLKGGVSARRDRWRGQVLVSHVARQYSDATNAVQVADATRGIVPSYTIVDLSVGYGWNKFTLSAGCNNATDARYFTRRASGYPGPGLLPAEARSVYASLRVDL